MSETTENVALSQQHQMGGISLCKYLTYTPPILGNRTDWTPAIQTVVRPAIIVTPKSSAQLPAALIYVCNMKTHSAVEYKGPD